MAIFFGYITSNLTDYNNLWTATTTLEVGTVLYDGLLRQVGSITAINNDEYSIIINGNIFDNVGLRRNINDDRENNNKTANYMLVRNKSNNTNEIITLKGAGGVNLLDFKFTDYQLNDQSWLRSDLFSWQDGHIYSSVYTHLLNDYNNFEQEVKKYLSSEVSLQGSLADNEGVLSNFSSKNHARLLSPFVPENNSWKMVFKINIATLGRINTIFASSSSSAYQGVHVRIGSNNKLQLYLSSNGTHWNMADGVNGSFVFSSNVDYWIKAEYTGSEYIGSYSLDGNTWIPDVTVNNSTVIFNNNTMNEIGDEGYNTSQYFSGTIDLNESYIDIADNRWWSGVNYFSYKQAPDGHKIILGNDSTSLDFIETVYNNTGIGWYYILDTQNIRFKLPRSKWNFVGFRDDVGGYVQESLPNLTGEATRIRTENGTASGVFSYASSQNISAAGNGATTQTIRFNANSSNTTYQDNAPVQQRSTQMFLYFYVGQFSESATEQTAGITTAQLNAKIDLDGSNAVFDNLSSVAIKNINNYTNCIDYTTQISRSWNTDYTTSDAVYIQVGVSTTTSSQVYLVINGTQVLILGTGAAQYRPNEFFKIPANTTWKITGGGSDGFIYEYQFL